MQRNCYFFMAICFIAIVPLTGRAEEDEANPLRLVNPIAPSSRLSIVEEHKPVLRRDSEVDSPATAAVEQVAPEVEPKADLLTSDRKTEIEELLKSAKESDTLSDEQRSSIVALLEKSLESLRAENEAKKTHSQILKEIASVPERLTDLKNQLALPLAPSVDPKIDTLSLQEVDSQTAEITASLELARDTLKKNQARASELNDSRKQSQQRMNDLVELQAEIEKQLNDAKPEGKSEQYIKAWESELRTRLARSHAEELLLKAEVDLAKATMDFHPLQNDLDRREIARLEKEEQAWQHAAAEKRDQESAAQIEKAREKAQNFSEEPALLELASQNAALAELRSEYADKLHDITIELREVRTGFTAQETAFNKIRDKIDDLGMTEAIGILLRTHERKLPDERPSRVRAKEIEQELPQTELRVIETHELRQAMWDFDALTKTHAQPILDRCSTEDIDYDSKAAEAYRKVRGLLTTRREYLTDLHGDLQVYQTKLAELHFQLRKAITGTIEQKNYIGEHVLWIRSADIVSLADVDKSHEGLTELLEARRWMQVVQDVGVHLQSHLAVWLILLICFTVGLVLSDRIKDRIVEISESKPVTHAYRFSPTVEVAVESVLLASFIPGILFLLSLYLTRFPAASSLEQAIGVGLRWTSVMWLGLSLLQQVTRRGGLAECHFGWHSKNVSVIRKNLGLLITCGLPAVFTVMVIGAYKNGDYVSSLGRLSFMAGMSVMALFTHRLLDPYRAANGVWANREVWLYRVRHLVHASAVFVPTALTVVAGLGYVYSAHQLAFRAQLSVWLVLGVVLIQAMLMRYLRIARRSAAVRHMQHRRAELAENNDTEIPVEEEIDFKSIDTQVQRLLRGGTAVALVLGVLFIWADMVPALKILDRVKLWSIETMSADAVANGLSPLQWITLADVLLAASALLATIMAARNLPGLLNITVFERLPIDYGTRYALTAVSRYLISLVGIVLAFQCVGVTWRSVQWLVAAVTVGLGFGLQEIFANFVSGLIIFTERPVRVGDMVTVGGVTGKVTRVQIRATTITDFDRRELVVPNKRFITEDVINWTLSDPISRVILKVGIAYSCEPETASQELLRVADEHPLVLKEPEPTSVFIGFGDSTLDMELRVFVVGRDNVFQVRNELNMAINRAFKAANLEIAFPQRDLHIRSTDAAILTNAGEQRKAA